MTILQDVGSETAVLDEIARLRAENAILKAKAAARATARLSCKVTEKGGISVYGLGRFPVTLYQSQWEALAKFMPMLEEFMVDNADRLAVKE